MELKILLAHRGPFPPFLTKVAAVVILDPKSRRKCFLHVGLLTTTINIYQYPIYCRIQNESLVMCKCVQ